MLSVVLRTHDGEGSRSTTGYHDDVSYASRPVAVIITVQLVLRISGVVIWRHECERRSLCSSFWKKSVPKKLHTFVYAKCQSINQHARAAEAKPTCSPGEAGLILTSKRHTAHAYVTHERDISKKTRKHKEETRYTREHVAILLSLSHNAPSKSNDGIVLTMRYHQMEDLRAYGADDLDPCSSMGWHR
jgi:hypothetical protein